MRVQRSDAPPAARPWLPRPSDVVVGCSRSSRTASCEPCRLGNFHGVELLADRFGLITGEQPDHQVTWLRPLCRSTYPSGTSPLLVARRIAVRYAAPQRQDPGP